MPKYRKKPVIIEAVQIKNRMTVETLEGIMTGEPGDWLITGVAGEQYFCKDDIFKQTYELVVEYVPPTIPIQPYAPFNPWGIFYVGDALEWWKDTTTCLEGSAQGRWTNGKSIYCCPTHNNGTVWVFSSGNMAGGGAYTVINQVTGEKL